MWQDSAVNQPVAKPSIARQRSLQASSSAFQNLQTNSLLIPSSPTRSRAAASDENLPTKSRSSRSNNTPSRSRFFFTPRTQLEVKQLGGSSNLVGNSRSNAFNFGNVTARSDIKWGDAIAGNSEDFYQFSLSKGTSVRLSLEDLSGNADLQLLSSSGRPVKTSDRSGTASESIRQRLAAGSYFVRVTGNADYNLRLRTSGGRFDPGSAPSQALDAGTLSRTQRDYRGRIGGSDSADVYKVNLAETGRLNVALSGLSRDASLQLLNSNGSVVVTSDRPDAADESISLSVSAGSYFVKVARNGRSGDYRLAMAAGGELSPLPTPSPSPTPNSSSDSLDTADVQSSPQFSRSGQVGNGDRNDFYRFTLNQTGSFNASLNGLNGDANLRLIQDANNNGSIDNSDVLASSQRWGSSSESIDRSLNAGTYFVQVTTSSNRSIDYNLSTSFSPSITTNSPVTNPPITNPPVTNPPITNPPVTNSPSFNAGSRPVLYITNSGRRNSNGLYELRVSLQQEGRELDSIPAISGQPGRQAFRLPSQSQSGSMEPLPEGYWDLGDIEWASGAWGNETKSWPDGNDGIGPIWVAMQPRSRTERSAIGIHLDNNASIFPGTIGCVGITNKSDMRKLVSWFYDIKQAPKVAVVDWGLGTLPS